MSDTIVGMMWNRNEGDILEETIESALEHVDTLFIADDNSTDNSWDIIQSFGSRIEYMRNKREHPLDQGQRTSLLKEIQKRYKAENTWVQIIESDIMILDTNVRTAIKEWAHEDLGVTWQLLNGARWKEEWDVWDMYPDWKGKSIREVLPIGHWVEYMLYTFRPMPDLYYDMDVWRPWPRGFQKYLKEEPLKRGKKGPTSPLLGHYGYRGPKYFFNKYSRDKKWRKYPSWSVRTFNKTRDTVYYFNGHWNKNLFPMSRKGWRMYRGYDCA
jgi:glycosyltransferase involved in cell wall biosynthesis